VRSHAYRTSSAKLTPEIIAALTKCDADMRELANLEQWPVEAAASETAKAAVQAAIDSKQIPETLKELSKSIDLLMTGWQQHRNTVAAHDAEAKEQQRLAAEKQSEGL
jgi:hypothetical protein